MKPTETDQIQALQKEVFELSMYVESLHYSVAKLKTDKEDIVKIVVDSVCNSLNINNLDIWHKKEYHAKWMPDGKGRMPKAIQEQPLIRAKVILICFLRFVFPQTHFCLKSNFSWFSERQEAALRRLWKGMLSPTTPADILLREEALKVQTEIAKKINLDFSI